MRIGPKDSVFDRATRALAVVDGNGHRPLQWTIGRDVWNRLRRDATGHAVETFFGLPFRVKGSVPPDLLELEVS